ncbi:winged helix-turn-helix domain-containing protein [Gallaecimonas mangrovi]|uniref:winged helix-turn-helix domain-containing protein n=1 Tax=Gallaecimonas mangrovi TaxID=2291597 RepID=UPI000E207F88|nr:winged helix-turn-helix domain-containing protein [Gallaecimonas mangrovi]
MAHGVFKIGRFYLNTEQKTLLDEHQQEVSLEAKVQEILLYLFENRDRYVTLEELHDNVWAGRVVSDSAVRRAISKLRKLLGDQGEPAHYIKSVVKKGYKFVCDVEETEDLVPESQLRPKVKKKKPILKKIGFYFLYLLLISIIVVLFKATFFRLETLDQNDVLFISRDLNSGDLTYVGFSSSDMRYQLFYRKHGGDEDHIIRSSSNPLMYPFSSGDSVWVGWQNKDKCGLLKISKIKNSTEEVKIDCEILSHISRVSETELLITMKKDNNNKFLSYLFDTKSLSLKIIPETDSNVPFIAALSPNKKILALTENSSTGSILRLVDIKRHLQLRDNTLPENIIQLKWNGSLLKIATEHKLFSLDSHTGKITQFEVRPNVTIKNRIIDFCFNTNKNVQSLNDNNIDIKRYQNTYLLNENKITFIKSISQDPNRKYIGDNKEIYEDVENSNYFLKKENSNSIILKSNVPIKMLDTNNENKSILLSASNQLFILNSSSGVIEYNTNFRSNVKQAIAVPNMPAYWLIVETQAGWQTLLWNYGENKLTTIALNERFRFKLQNKLYWVDSRDNKLKTQSDNEHSSTVSGLLPLTDDTQWVVDDDHNIWFSISRPYGEEIYGLKIGEETPHFQVRVKGFISMRIKNKKLIVEVESKPNTVLSSSMKIFTL